MKRFFNLSFKNPFEKRRYVVLVDNEPVNLGESEVVDVILSPRYYWAKKENLPVKYTHQAKKYAPSSFDGVIPSGHYSFLTCKGDEGFWLYAYDDSFILSELEKLGLKPQQIGRVFFAQNEFMNIKKPIKANKNESLANHNGSIIKVPNQLADKPVELGQFFLEHKLSNFYVNLNKFSTLIDFKKAYIIASTLLALIVFYGIEAIWLSSVQSEQVAKKQSITKKYKMPATNMQANALIRQLDKKLSTQKALREKFYELTKMPLIENEYLQSMNFATKKVTLSLKLANPNRVKAVQKYLQKFFKMQNVNKKGNNVTFEVKI